jgi:hypothetical protein
MKNIHLIPTDKPSRLHLGNSGLVLCDLNFGKNTINGQNIYITNSEEINERDWVVTPNKNIMLVTTKYATESSFMIGNSKHKGAPYYIEFCRKIILTTDQDLIAEGVQAIDDEFLEWFVKNPSCESVEIDLVPVNEFGSEITVGGYGFDKFIYKIIYKIIIPQKEPKQFVGRGMTYIMGKEPNPKEEPKISPLVEELTGVIKIDETLEEAAERIFREPFRKNLTLEEITIDGKDAVNCMLSLADWQAERMYTEEEVRKISIDFFFHWWNTRGNNTEQGFDEWFEKFKKK